MPARSEADAQAAIAAAVELILVNQTNMAAVLTEITALEAAYGGDRVSSVSGGVASLRSALAGSIQAARAILDPLWLDYGQALEFPETAVEAVLDRLYQDFILGTHSVKTRAITFGSPAAGGGNVGTGALLRLTVDEENKPIEIGVAEDLSARCIAIDTPGAEVFEVRGDYAVPDGLQILGSGTVSRLTTQTADRSLLQNASFSQGVNGVSITGWDVSAGSVASITYDSTNYYRPAGPSDTAPRSLEATATISIRQNLTANRQQIARGTPYILQLAWNREVGSAEGTLTLQLGGATAASVVVAAQTGWNVLRIAINDKMWLKGFSASPLYVTVGWTRTAGDLLIDDVRLMPMTQIRGQWYSLQAAVTNFALGDVFTWADTIATDAKIQAVLQRVYGKYLPSAGTPSWADPS